MSTGVTLRENNLRQIEGGHIMDSQGVLVGNRRALLERPGLLEVVHELIERLEAHLTAEKFYSVIANMRGTSAADVSERLLKNELLGGLQGPTVSPVFTLDGDRKAAEHGFYAAVVCVPKKQLYPAVKEIRKVRKGGRGIGGVLLLAGVRLALEMGAAIRGTMPPARCWRLQSLSLAPHRSFCPTHCLCSQIGGSGVLVQPMTYIFDEEPARWLALLDTLGVERGSVDVA